jgi:hypothetical protein
MEKPEILQSLTGVISADQEMMLAPGRKMFHLENVIYPELALFQWEDFQQAGMSPTELLEVLKTELDVTPVESGDLVQDLNQLLADESFRQKIASKAVQEKTFVWPSQITRQERLSIEGRIVPDQRVTMSLLKAFFPALVPYKATAFDVEVYSGMTFVKIAVTQSGYRNRKLMDVTLFNPALSRLTDLGWGGVARLLDGTLREARIKLMDDFLALARKQASDLTMRLDAERLYLGVHIPRTQWIDFDIPAGDIESADELDGVIARVEAYRNEFAAAAADASAIPVRSDEVGGIDLAQKHLDMQIQRDGEGIPLPVSEQDFSGIRLEGLKVRIEFIRPLESGILR